MLITSSKTTFARNVPKTVWSAHQTKSVTNVKTVFSLPTRSAKLAKTTVPCVLLTQLAQNASNLSSSKTMIAFAVQRNSITTTKGVRIVAKIAMNAQTPMTVKLVKMDTSSPQRPAQFAPTIVRHVLQRLSVKAAQNNFISVRRANVKSALSTV